MKKALGILSATFVVALSCSVEPMDPAPEAAGEETVILRADFDEAEPETRTVRQSDGKVLWSASDEIVVVRGAKVYGNKFTSLNSTPQATAEFRGTMPSGSGSYWAVHPYDASAYFDGTYLVTTLPEQQEAVPGTFADDLFISVAYSNSDHLSFYHVVGGVKFSVTEPGIKKVTLIAAGDEPLAGLIGVQNVNGRPAITAWGSDMFSKIELSPASGTFEVGKAYHFVTMPATLSKGFTLFFEKEDGAIAFREVSKSVTIKAAGFRTLMEADKDVVWEKDVFRFTPSSVSVDAAGGAFSLSIHSTGSFHVDDSNCDWISQVSASGDPRFPSGAEYVFSASRNTGAAREGYLIVCDDQSGNCFPVTVSQGSGESLKVIPHHSLGMRFTATWCGYCPKMDETFHKIKENQGDRFEYMCLYATSGNYGLDACTYLANDYLVGGFPTGIIDGRFELLNYTSSDYGASVAASAISETESCYPAATSIALSSSLSGQTITLKSKVYALSSDTYKISAFLLEDGIVGYQANYFTGSTNTFEHNRVARLLLNTNVHGDAFPLDGGQTKSFSWTATVPSGCNLNNLSVLVYVQRPFGSRPAVQSNSYGDYYIDNCRAAAVGAEAAPEWE